MVTIELFGVPRLRAGRAKVVCDAETVGRALRNLTATCPALEDTVVVGDRVRPSYVLSINGERFVSDPEDTLQSGDVLMLLSADVGG